MTVMNPKAFEEFLAIDLRPGDLVINLPVSRDGSVLSRFSCFAYLILSAEVDRQHAVLTHASGQPWRLTRRNSFEIWAPEGAWRTCVFRRGGKDR